MNILVAHKVTGLFSVNIFKSLYSGTFLEKYIQHARVLAMIRDKIMTECLDIIESIVYTIGCFRHLSL